MSDFRLNQIADAIGKDARTVRRWCERGFIPGAYRSAGGHWRVQSADIGQIAYFARMNALGFSRSRPRRERVTAKGFRQQQAAVAACEAVAEVYGPETAGVIRRHLAGVDKLAGQTGAAAVAVKRPDATIFSAVVESASRSGSRSVGAVARMLGISRRTAYRVGLAELVGIMKAKGAALEVELAPAADGVAVGFEFGERVESVGFDYDDIDARLGWVEPVTA